MESQKIKRSDLLTIYNSVCESWQKEITTLALFQTSTEVEIPNSLIIKAYSEADSSQKEMLSNYFKLPETLDLKKIKSFKDILKLSNKKMSEVLPYSKPQNKAEIKVNALSKIMLISEVLNEGWEPDWVNNNQYKYFPYFKFNSEVGLVFNGYYCCVSYCCSGEVAFYKNEDIAKFAGEVFSKEYGELITGIIQN